MITPSSFAVHVTYTCPLACAHCCFSSSPKSRERLDPGLVIDTIRNLDQTAIEMVCFTGGEPFLLGDHLVEFVKLATERGFKTRVVTSAYFGRTPKAATQRMEKIAAAGLKELSISWDDFHEEFVSFETIKNVAHAASEIGGILIAVNIVQGAQAKWTVERVRREIGVDLEVVCESPLNLTGRAAEELSNLGLRSERFLGPCPYVMTGPTLAGTGKLLACCGVIPDTDRLCIDPDFKPEALEAGIKKGQASLLFQWLYLRGPYAIMEWIGEHYSINIPTRDTIGGNCEACKHLFENPAIDALLDEAVAVKAQEIIGEFELLRSLGASDPASILGLWHDQVPLPPHEERRLSAAAKQEEAHTT
jgi:organic radical activating enzyme